MSKEIEEWKDIPGYEGLYQVSDWGRVKSLERIVMRKNGRSCSVKEKIMRQMKNECGHLQVKLSKNGFGEHPSVHVLVAKAFVENTSPDYYTVVHHIDHNPQNNMAENLVWMNEGEHHAEHNTKDKSKAVYQYTLEGKLVAMWENAYRASEELGFAQSCIGDACRGGRFDRRRGKWVNINQYKGYIWSYIKL